MVTSAEQAVADVRSCYESRIQENAERIRQHIGYVLQRLDAGRADSVGLYAEDIEASARRIVFCVAALSAVAEVSAIYESTKG